MKPGSLRPSSVLFEHYVVRVIVSLCSIASRTTLHDVRDDMRDASAILIRLTALALADESEESREEIRIWCDRMTTTLDALPIGDELLHVCPTARLAVIRLRSLIPVPAEAKAPAVSAKKIPTKPTPTRGIPAHTTAHQKKILECVRQHPNMRTRELLSRLVPGLSDRTVKRCLKELVAAGSLERVKDQGAVSYRLSGPTEVLDQ